MNKLQIILLGAPGSGKGTQAARIVELGYNHISTGDLLREEIKKGTTLGNKLKEIISEGKLVDDATVLELLAANINLKNGAYIFDGFPRTLAQAEMLKSVILKDEKSVALYLEVNLDELVSRIVNRRTCGTCNEIYNLVNKPSQREGLCDKCNGTLVQRKDDNEETVKNRMNVFKAQIEPILAYYKQEGILEIIDASINPDTTFGHIKKIIDAK